MGKVLCLTTVFLGTLVAAAGIWLPEDRSIAARPADVAPNRNEKQDREQAVRQWALGCATVLTERNYDSHTLLAGNELTEQNKLTAQRLLSESWGIDNRKDLLETLAWLDQEGHRADFATRGRKIWPLSQEDYERLLAEEDDMETINRVHVVREYYVQLGAKSLYGWDYSRAICLCRWAYTVGYLNEEEAWGRILPMARLLQAVFDSWEDLGRNYLIGRQFWSYEDSLKDGWRYEDAVQRLLDMRDSPWNQYPWALDLSNDDPAIEAPSRRPDSIVAAR